MAQQQQLSGRNTPAGVEDRIKGTIVGSALGDTIGLYTEFLSKEHSQKAYPDAKFQLVDPVTEFCSDGHRNKFEKKSWTDDTDHALLIILSYLHHDGKELLPNDLAARLRIWVEQGLLCLERLPLGLGDTVGRVVLNPKFLDDSAGVAYKFWNNSGRTIAPNGSLMRTHPLGVICIHASLHETFQTAAKFSIVTHADPRCVVSCCVSTALIRGILRGEVSKEGDIDLVIEEAFTWVNEWLKRNRRFADELAKDGNGDAESDEPPLDRELFEQHVRASNLQDLKLDDHAKIGYVYKGLGSGILALRLGMRSAPKGRDSPPPSNLFESIITDLVMEGGDADTNACIAAAILGSWLGYDALPPSWRDGMEHREWLLQKCDGIMQTLGVSESSSGRSYKGSEDPDTRRDGGKGFLTRPELEAREMAFVARYMMMHETELEREKKEAKAKKGWFSKILRN